MPTETFPQTYERDYDCLEQPARKGFNIARTCHCDRSFPENTKHLYSICTTSAPRLRRWSNIVQMLHKYFVFVGLRFVQSHREVIRMCNDGSIKIFVADQQLVCLFLNNNKRKYYYFIARSTTLTCIYSAPTPEHTAYFFVDNNHTITCMVRIFDLNLSVRGSTLDVRL